MLSLSRLALRSRAIAPRLAAQNLHPLAFHTGAPRQEEQKQVEAVAPVAEDKGFLGKYGLDDVKISGPIALAVSIPALSNGFYVLNEESQLACCFLLFCTSVYKFGGEAIASYFDSRAAAILAEHTQVEDANIQLAKETLNTHESLLSIHEDIAAVAEAHKAAVELMCQVQAAKLRHKTRDTFVKNLEAVREIESSYNLELQNAMINNATKKVRAVVEKGDKNLKNGAFKNAIDVLSNTSDNDNKEDEIASLFIKEIRSYAESLESQKGKVMKLTDAEQKELQAELDAYMKRFDIEEGKLTAPKEIKFDLM